MSEQSILESVRDLGFLHGIADEYLREIAAVARLVEFPEGQLVFREGEPPSSVFLICSGTVSLEISAPGMGCRRIFTVGEGELLGWSALLEQTLRMATARTLTPVRAVELSGSQLLTLCEHNPRFGYELMRRVALQLAMRLSATRMQLLDMFGVEMPTAAEDPQQ
jgi:CRP-like cAMP-binding protein